MTLQNLLKKRNCKKGRFASQFREIENSRIEINPWNDAQREEDQLSEMGAETHIQRGSISNEGQFPVEEQDSIIIPKRSAEAGSSAK